MPHTRPQIPAPAAQATIATVAKAMAPSGSTATRRANEKRRCSSESGTIVIARSSSQPDRAAATTPASWFWKKSPTSGEAASEMSDSRTPLTSSEKNAVLAASSMRSLRLMSAAIVPDSANRTPKAMRMEPAANVPNACGSRRCARTM